VRKVDNATLNVMMFLLFLLLSTSPWPSEDNLSLRQPFQSTTLAPQQCSRPALSLSETLVLYQGFASQRSNSRMHITYSTAQQSRRSNTLDPKHSELAAPRSTGVPYATVRIADTRHLNLRSDLISVVTMFRGIGQLGPDHFFQSRGDSGRWSW